MAVSEKKMRNLLRRIHFHYNRLQGALNDAFRADLISYTDFKTEAPCSALWEVKTRVEKTTEKQISEIVNSSIRRDV